MTSRWEAINVERNRFKVSLQLRCRQRLKSYRELDSSRTAQCRPNALWKTFRHDTITNIIIITLTKTEATGSAEQKKRSLVGWLKGGCKKGSLTRSARAVCRRDEFGDANPRHLDDCFTIWLNNFLIVPFRQRHWQRMAGLCYNNYIPRRVANWLSNWVSEAADGGGG